MERELSDAELDAVAGGLVEQVTNGMKRVGYVAKFAIVFVGVFSALGGYDSDPWG